MNERELLVDCLRRLNRSGVTYYFTGSMASNYWGIPRTTHDLDFVIQMPPSAVSKIVQAFSGDFYLDEATVRAAYKPPHQFNAIDIRSALKVDFWLPKPEPFDREMLRRRVSATYSANRRRFARRRMSFCTSSIGIAFRHRTVSLAMPQAWSPCKRVPWIRTICDGGHWN